MEIIGTTIKTQKIFASELYGRVSNSCSSTSARERERERERVKKEFECSFIYLPLTLLDGIMHSAVHIKGAHNQCDIICGVHDYHLGQ